jgi:hypothetical protein
MRLEFKVLWFENQMADMRGAVGGLRQELARHGFTLDLDQQPDASNLEQLALHQERYHDYDLVVVDYDLGAGQPKGDEVAKRIRTSFGFTDIVFYSGAPTEELRDRVRAQAIDGVYCSGRRQLRDKLIEHVGFIVERLSRLEAMRGLAVSTAGRCDDHMREVVRQAHALMDEAGQNALIAAIDKKVIGSAQSRVRQFAKLKDLEGRLENRAVTSVVLYEAAQTAVETVLAHRPQCEPQLLVLRKYLEEVIQPRNNLGHNVEVREENGWVVRSKAGVEIDRQSLSEFRRNLSKHLDNFITLSANLAAVEQA